ncbi:MAG: hypothetical protein Roseis2KO_30890 [Roseivirga sp.]
MWLLGTYRHINLSDAFCVGYKEVLNQFKQLVMKKVKAAIRKEYQSELDKFNKLPESERVFSIICWALLVVTVMGGVAYDIGEFIGLQIGSMIA